MLDLMGQTIRLTEGLFKLAYNQLKLISKVEFKFQLFGNPKNQIIIYYISDYLEAGNRCYWK